MSTLKDRTVRLAHLISEYLNSEGIDMWLEYGAALGGVREGGIITGDLDIDFGIWWKDWGRFRNMILQAQRSREVGGPLYEIASSIPFAFDFRTFPAFEHKSFPLGGEVCKIKVRDPSVELKVDNPRYTDSLYLEIYGFEEFNNVKSSPINYGSSYRSKLYYHKNLKQIKFEGFDFYVSKYVEKYLDYIYKDVGGEGMTWRTPTEEKGEKLIHSWYNEDKVTGYVEGVFDLFHKGHLRLLKRANKIFDKVLAAVTPDDIVKTYKDKLPVIPFEDRKEMLESCKYIDEVITGSPTLIPTINWMEENGIDYIVAGRSKESPIDKWYSEIINEERLLLLDETPDYHTADLIKKISI